MGKLEKGYSFDVQIVDYGEGIPRFCPEKREEDLLHKILLLTESRSIKEVWVQGEKVKSGDLRKQRLFWKSSTVDFFGFFPDNSIYVDFFGDAW